MQSLRQLGSAGVLEAIQKHFRAPPISVLEAWEPANLLDSLPFNRSDIYNSTNTGLIDQLLQQSVELQNAVGLKAVLRKFVNGVPCLLNGHTGTYIGLRLLQLATLTGYGGLTPIAMRTQVANDMHADIHRSLHGLLDIIKPDLDACLKFGEGLSLEDQGAEVTESVASLAAYDLRYNPRSLRSWDSLASALPQTADCTGAQLSSDAPL